MTTDELIDQLKALETHANAMARIARDIRQEIVKVATQAVEPDSAESPDTSCRCPSNQRMQLRTMKHPNRTVCRLCGKEFE